MLRYIIVALVLVSTTVLSFAAYAKTQDNSGDTMVLTLDECVDKALNSNNGILKNNIDLNAMRRQYDELKVMKDSMNYMMENLDSYTALYAKEQEFINSYPEDQRSDLQKRLDEGKLSVDEQTALNAKMDAAQQLLMSQYKQIYRPMFGPIPPVANTQKDKYNIFIKGATFAYYDMGAAIKNMELMTEASKALIKQSIRMMYNGVLSFEEGVSIQEELYDVQENQYASLLAKLQNGQVSELDRFTSEISLEQLKINIDKMKRSIANMKMDLKKQTGINLTQEIMLQQYVLEKDIKEPLTYDEYLNKAIDNRWQIQSVRNELEAKNKELDIMKQYVSDTSSIEWQEAQQGVTEKSLSFADAIRSVTVDIKTKYNDVIEKKGNIQLAKQKESNGFNQYSTLLNQYKQGYITESILQSAEMGYHQAKIAYQQALRDYDSALYNLELACGVGSLDITMMGVR